MRMQKVFLIGAIAVLGLITSDVLHAQTANLDWQAGYKWTYSRVNLWNNSEIGKEEISVLEAAADRYKMRYRGGSEYEALVLPDGTRKRTVETSVGSISYDEAPIKFPLADGSRWTYTEYWASRYPGAVKNEVECTVDGTESVKVPAGQFDTIRVKCRGYAHAPRASGRTERTYWYSPAARWVVKVQYKSYWGGLDQNEESVLVEMLVPK